ncbi:LytR/AlgR family response regulator transcription factor [Chitinophagaceae bacterium LWZ2-11]
MKCVVVDDEPLAREAVELLIGQNAGLTLSGSFGSAVSATKFIKDNPIDLIFLDIQMPGVNGIDFAKSIQGETLIIFITAFSEYALDSYEVEAVDYLVKPVQHERFQKAVDKAQSYLQLLTAGIGSGNNITSVQDDYFFVKADRKIFKIHFKDIRFIEGLKDYVIVNVDEQKIMTAMNIKTIYDQLPKKDFFRISKSYIINVNHIASFDNNTVYIGKHEIPIGNAFRNAFFDEYVTKKLFHR